MLRSVTQQNIAVLGALLLGAGAGLLWDVLALLRARVRPGRFRAGVWDVLYCAVLTAAVLLFLLRHTDGAVHSWMLWGGGAGLGLWRVGLSPLLRRGRQKR